jgi:hypothetical protein
MRTCTADLSLVSTRSAVGLESLIFFLSSTECIEWTWNWQWYPLACPSARPHTYFPQLLERNSVRQKVYVCSCLFIHYQWFHSPLLWPWPLVRFRTHFYTDGRTPWAGDQPIAMPLPTTQTQTKRTYRHWCLEWNSSPRSQRQSEDSTCLRPRGHCDRLLLGIVLPLHL